MAGKSTGKSTKKSTGTAKSTSAKKTTSTKKSTTKSTPKSSAKGTGRSTKGFSRASAKTSTPSITGYQLVIAEKPDMGRKIATVLGANSQKNGYLEGNGYVVTYAIGHLYGLADPSKYDKKYEKWNMDDLPILPTAFKLEVSKGKSGQIAVIKSLIAGASSIVNSTDAGREGELIYRYITQALKVNKSIPQYRLWISSLTPESIKRGFQHLKPLSDYDNLGESARLRSEADWLVGMNGSRAFTLQFGGRGGYGALSVGRVQTPTLAMIYDRIRAIETFVPTTYYDLYGYFNQDGNHYRGKWQGERIEDKKKAEAIVAKTSQKQGMVTSVTSSEKKEYAPRLYCLSTLQRDASARYKFGAKKTLDLAQSLYEKRGVISYPRTSSQYVTKDEVPVMQDVFQKLSGAFSQWSKNGQTKLVHVNNKLVVDESKVTDHHALLPTGKHSSSLTPDEKKIYELIVQRFFMQFFPPAIYKVHEAITEVEGEKFKTTAKQVIDLGWKANFSRQDEAEDDGEEIGFNIQKKPSFCERTEAEEKTTQPPKPYTEGTLITALRMAGNSLDVNDDETKELKEILNTTEGIGTEATRAGIIETLKKREYIVNDHGKVMITEKGRHIIEVIRKTPLEILTSASMTAKWEQALNQVAEGKMPPSKFDAQVRQFSTHIIQVVRGEKGVQLEQPEIQPRKSEKPVSPKQPVQMEQEEQENYRPSSPPPKLFSGAGKSRTKPTSVSKPSAPSKGVKGTNVTGAGTKKVYFDESVGSCPKCGAPVVENSVAYGCSRWREGCKFTIWKEIGKKRIPENQVKLLLKVGKTETISGFKKGAEIYSAYLQINALKEVEIKIL